MAIWRQRELDGEAMIVQMDESYIHRFHHANMGLRLNDAHGQPISELENDKRPGQRLCIIGCISCFGRYGGHVVAEKPGGEGPYMAQEFRKLGEPTMEQGGHWVELDRNGNDRHAKQKKPKKVNFQHMKKADIKGWLLAHDVEQDEIDEVNDTKDALVELALHKQYEEEGNAIWGTGEDEGDNGGDFRPGDGVTNDKKILEQLAFTNWEKLRERLQDSAPTTDLMMIAGMASGDYHKNLDTHSNFKWWCTLEITFTEFSKDLQRALDAELAANPHAVPDPDNNPHNKPFYDWDNDRPTRALVVFQDNCASHHGIDQSITTKTKDECLKIFRMLGRTQITFKREVYGQTVDFNYELPTTGPFPRKNPTREEVHEGLMRVLKECSPWSIRRPYDMIIEAKKDAWGPPHLPGLSTVFAAPYVSSQVAVELTWADGKGHCARPEQQSNTRSFATLIKQLTDRWYTGPNHGWKMFRHCGKVIEKAVAHDSEEFDGPMSGTYPNFDGLPDDNTLREWKMKAGILHTIDEIEEEDDEDEDEDLIIT